MKPRPNKTRTTPRHHPLVESRIDDIRSRFVELEKGHQNGQHPTLPAITRLRVAADRVARGGPNIRDGYPTGGHDGGSGISNPTCAAALDRARPADLRRTDPIGVEFVKALSALGHAIDALDSLCAALDRIDQITLDEPVDVVECEHHRAAGIHVGEHVAFTDVGGSLERPMRLCSTCHQFARDVKAGRRRPTEGPGSVLPTVEQVRHHADTGRWVIRGDIRTVS